MAQIDISNAYGCVSREAVFARVQEVCPELLPYAVACYGQQAVVANKDHTAVVTQGVHQGDPLSPLFFALAIHPAVTSASSLTSLCLWYLDDGTLIGTPEQIQAG